MECCILKSSAITTVDLKRVDQAILRWFPSVSRLLAIPSLQPIWYGRVLPIKVISTIRPFLTFNTFTILAISSPTSLGVTSLHWYSRSLHPEYHWQSFSFVFNSKRLPIARCYTIKALANLLTVRREEILKSLWINNWHNLFNRV